MGGVKRDTAARQAIRDVLRCRWPPRGENWVVPDTVADYMNEYADLHTQWVVLKCTRFFIGPYFAQVETEAQGEQ